MLPANHIERTGNGYAYDGVEAVGLAPRESQALLLIAAGKTQAEAAIIMCCSANNIKNRVSNLFYKLRAESSTQLIARAFKCGALRLLVLMLALHTGIAAPLMSDDQIARRVRPRTRTSQRVSRARRGDPLQLNINDFLNV